MFAKCVVLAEHPGMLSLGIVSSSHCLENSLPLLFAVAESQHKLQTIPVRAMIHVKEIPVLESLSGHGAEATY